MTEKAKEMQASEITPTGKPSKRATSDIVYKSLKDDILHLVLPPGSAISEIETAVKYNVSRTPVRDAFKALEIEHLLEVRPHIGTFVSYIDMNQISDTLFTREVLEQAVLKILCNSYTQTQILKVKLALNEQQQLLEGKEALTPEEYQKLGTRFLKLDNEFHYLLFQLTGKGNVWNMLVRTGNNYERFRTLINWGEYQALLELYEQHCTIINSVIKKDTDGLMHIISDHIYGGFASNADIIIKNSSYFLPDTDFRQML